MVPPRSHHPQSAEANQDWRIPLFNLCSVRYPEIFKSSSGQQQKICVPELEQREGFSPRLPSLILVLAFQKDKLF